LNRVRRESIVREADLRLPGSRYIVIKRLVAAAFVSVVAVVGIAPTATAASGHTGSHVVQHAIDWD
jgi:hypothetical protein